jgi:hypothetical protein
VVGLKCSIESWMGNVSKRIEDMQKDTLMVAGSDKLLKLI